ncbi:hypothetical protein BSKO_08924 [Bryopsis sp. KO-2023]|nr:hypothetical protein BSKO_08924 [Bryopsis sp. KO-2023]
MQFFRRAQTSATIVPVYIPRRQNLVAKLEALKKLDETGSELLPLGNKAPSPCRQLVQDYLNRIQRVAGDECSSVSQAIGVLQDQKELKSREEFANWGEDKWSGLIRAGATAAAARLSRSKGGPESAETFLKTILDNDILPPTASGPVIGAVLHGFSRKKNLDKVVESASKLIPPTSPGSPLLNPRTLAVVLDACQSPTVLNHLWGELVTPTLKRRRLALIPRVVSSTYLNASFKFDLSTGRNKGLVECVEGEGNVPTAIAAIWNFENEHLDGPLLMTRHLLALIPKASSLEDIWMLLNSSLGSRRGGAKPAVVGYTPSVSPMDMLWEGHDSQARRFWGAPLAARAIRKYIAMDAYQKAIGIVGGSLRCNRVSMPVNALLEASSQNGNIQMAVSAIQLLRAGYSSPKLSPSQAFLNLLAITPPPWGTAGKPDLFLEKAHSLLTPSIPKWTCIVKCMLLCGATKEDILQKVEAGMEPAGFGPVSGKSDVLGKARYKVLKRALRLLCENSKGAETLDSIERVLGLVDRYCGEVLTEATRDSLVAVVISSLKEHRKPLQAIKKGALRDSLGKCIRLGYLPGPKAERALLHVCKTRVNDEPLPLASTKHLSALGFNVDGAVRSIEVEQGVPRAKATLILASGIQGSIISEGFASIHGLVDRTRRCGLLKEALEKEKETID